MKKLLKKLIKPRAKSKTKEEKIHDLDFVLGALGIKVADEYLRLRYLSENKLPLAKREKDRLNEIELKILDAAGFELSEMNTKSFMLN